MAQPPNDAISALVFAPDAPNRLLVSSWDKSVYLYEITNGTEEAILLKTFEHRAPVLDVCFGANQDEAFTAGMDRQVKRFVVRRFYMRKSFGVGTLLIAQQQN